MNSQHKKLAVLTSGGDAPGMNAALRSIVRVGVGHGLEIIAIRRGFKGLLLDEFMPLGPRDVSNIIQRGGTIIKTARSEEFKTPAGLQKAKENLERNKIEGLILIGGDGTFRGGGELAKVWPGQIIGVPGTIDNDVWGTAFTIGFDTAVNTAMEGIDKIRDTAESHERFFLVEVMGRHSGFIALEVGIASGAEEILMPEQRFEIREICDRLCRGRARGKASSIMVVAEGQETGGAMRIAKEMQRLSQIESRVVILGHLQRGGQPTAKDRVLATKLGAHAVEMFIRGAGQIMVGEVGGQLCTTPLEETWTKRKELDPFLLTLHPLLSS
ncbi:MAG: 6-phosphofructokinase [Verrucomicrobia bacterium]|nr:6-phosphofructokinase [Verrucomicrobiota bacterium]